jgi:hypothetical protein
VLAEAFQMRRGANEAIEARPRSDTAAVVAMA